MCRPTHPRAGRLPDVSGKRLAELRAFGSAIRDPQSSRAVFQGPVVLYRSCPRGPRGLSSGHFSLIDPASREGAIGTGLTRLEPVLNAVAMTAARLCEAHGVLRRARVHAG